MHDGWNQSKYIILKLIKWFIFDIADSQLDWPLASIIIYIIVIC